MRQKQRVYTVVVLGLLTALLVVSAVPAAAYAPPATGGAARLHLEDETPPEGESVSTLPASAQPASGEEGGGSSEAPASPSGGAGDASGSPPESGSPPSGGSTSGDTSASTGAESPSASGADSAASGSASLGGVSGASTISSTGSSAASSSGASSGSMDSSSELPASEEALMLLMGAGLSVSEDQYEEVDDNSIIVFTEAALVEAITGANGYTTVYLGANIKSTKPMPIATTKPFFVLDGHPPGAEDGVRYTFEDPDSSSSSYTINARSTNTASITLQNLIWTGRNYYGVCSFVSGTSITLRNVQYTGPQPVWNANGGDARFDDCVVVLVSTFTPAQELAEAHNVYFGGASNTITHQDGSYVCSLNGNNQVGIDAGTQVTVAAQNYFMTGGSSCGLTIGDGGALYLTDKAGLASGALGAVNVGANATLSIHQDAASTGSVTGMQVSGTLTMGAGSALDIVRNGAGDGLYLTGTGASATFNGARSVSISSQGGNGINLSGGSEKLQFNGTGPVSVSTTGSGKGITVGTSGTLTLAGAAGFSVSTASGVAVELNSGVAATFTGPASGVAPYTIQSSASRCFDLTGANASVSFSGAINMSAATTGANAVFRMAGNPSSATFGAGVRAVMQSPAGSVFNNTNNNVSLNFNNPQRIALYAGNLKPVTFYGSSNKISISTGALNRWATATALSGIDALSATPTAVWNKGDGSSLTLSGTSAANLLTSISSNIVYNIDPLAGGDPVSSALNALTLDMSATGVLVFGELPLTVAAVTDASTAATGSTAAGAAVRVDYTSILSPASATGAADAAGNYAVAMDVNASVGTLVTVTAHADMLKANRRAVVLDSDLFYIALSAPDTLSFGTVPISSAARRVPRADTGFALTVTDTRLTRAGWRLEAAVATPLTATIGGTEHRLPGAMVFVDDAGVAHAMEDGAVVVYERNASFLPLYTLNWAADRGPMVLLPPGAGRSGVSYSTTIHWALVDAP